MKKMICLLFICLGVGSCKREHYGCICLHPSYHQDYGTHSTRQASRYRSECKKHEVDANTSCDLVTNY